MKKTFSYLLFFILGIFFNQFISIAFAYSDISSLDIWDFDSAVQQIISNKISEYDFDFENAVEGVVENCAVVSGKISC